MPEPSKKALDLLAANPDKWQDFKAKYGSLPETFQPPAASARALELLAANPDKIGDFEAKYGYRPKPTSGFMADPLAATPAPTQVAPSAPEAEAIAPPTTDAEEPGVLSNLGGLAKRSGARVLSGLATLGELNVDQPFLKKSAAEAAKLAFPTVGPVLAAKIQNVQTPEAIQNLQDAAKAPFTAVKDKAVQWEQDAVNALSPEWQAGTKEQLIQRDAAGHLEFGAGAKDPYYWLALGVDMSAMMAPGMAATASAARLSYAARYGAALAEAGAKKIPQSLAEQFATKAAEKAASRAAVIAGGLSEGGIAGGMNAQQVEQTLDQIDEPTMLKYPDYRRLRDQGMSHEVARAKISSERGFATGLASAVVTGLTGAPLNAWMGKLASGSLSGISKKAALAETGKATAEEAAQEFVQEGTDQTLTNLAEQPITGKGTWEGVLESALSGAIAGGIFGGGTAVAGQAISPSAPKPKGANLLLEQKSKYDQAQENLQAAQEAAADPSIRIGKKDIDEARETARLATVEYAQSLLQSGQLPEAKQQAVAAALEQARAAGVESAQVTPTNAAADVSQDATTESQSATQTPESAPPANTDGAPKALSDVETTQRDVLEKVATGTPLEAPELTSLVAAGLAKANSSGKPLLTPAGRRQRKQLNDRTATVEAAPEVKAPVQSAPKTEPIKAATIKPLAISELKESDYQALERITTDKPVTKEEAGNLVRAGLVRETTEGTYVAKPAGRREVRNYQQAGRQTSVERELTPAIEGATLKVPATKKVAIAEKTAVQVEKDLAFSKREAQAKKASAAVERKKAADIETAVQAQADAAVETAKRSPGIDEPNTGAMKEALAGAKEKAGVQRLSVKQQEADDMVDMSDLEAVIKGDATTVQVARLAERGLAAKNTDGTGKLLPAGRRRMLELRKVPERSEKNETRKAQKAGKVRIEESPKGFTLVSPSGQAIATVSTRGAANELAADLKTETAKAKNKPAKKRAGTISADSGAVVTGQTERSAKELTDSTDATFARSVADKKAKATLQAKLRLRKATKAMDAANAEMEKADDVPGVDRDGPEFMALVDKVLATEEEVTAAERALDDLDTAASVGKTKSKGVALEVLNEVASDLKRDLGINLRIVESISELPDYIRDIAAEVPETQGLFYRNPAGGTETWLIGENLADRKTAIEVGIHEAIGHEGLRAMLGDRYSATMRQIRDSFPNEARAAAARNQINWNHKDLETRKRLRNLAAEELVAYATARVLTLKPASRKLSVWQRIIDAVRTAGRQLGLIKDFTNGDIERMILRTRDFVKQANASGLAQQIAYEGKFKAAKSREKKAKPFKPSEFASAVAAGVTHSISGNTHTVTASGGSEMTAEAMPERGLLWVKSANVPADKRGSGLGVAMAERLVQEAYNSGLRLVSDNRVSDNATRVYGALARRGYKVKQNAARLDPGTGELISASELKPVFEVTDQELAAATRDFTGSSIAFSVPTKDQTETPTFKAWFGESKIVDDVGKPRRVFHGTHQEFTVFDAGEFGFHFSDNRAASGMFGTVREFYIRLNKPFVINKDLGNWAPEDMLKWLISREYKGPGTGIPRTTQDAVTKKIKKLRRKNIKALSQEDGEHSYSQALYELSAPVRELYQAFGYDGIQYKNEGEGGTSWIVFNPTQVKSATNNNGEFDSENPDVAYAVLPGNTGDPTLDSFLNKFEAPGKTLRQHWADWTTGIRGRSEEEIFDDLAGIKNTAAEAGIDITASGFKNAHLARSAAELTTAVLEHGPPRWIKDGTHEVAGVDSQQLSFLQILKPLGSNVDFWGRYMVARRAKDLKAQGRENLFTDAEIQKGLDLGAGRPEFDVAAAAYAALNKQVLDFAEYAGRIDPAARALWENQNYIPFYRVSDALANRGGSVFGPLGNLSKAIQQLRGGTANLGDPIENIVKNWHSLLDGALEAHAARTVIDAFDGTGLVVREPMMMAPVTVPMSQVKQWMQQNPRVSGLLYANGIDVQKLPASAFAGIQQMFSIQPPSDPEVVNVWRKGKREYWRVNDIPLLRGLTSIPYKTWGPWMELFRFPKRIYTATTTSTPQFQFFSNPIRDMLHSFVVGAVGRNTVVVPILDTAKGILSQLKQDQDAIDLLAAGGSFTHGYVSGGQDKAAAASYIRRTLKQRTNVGKILNTPAKLWRVYRELGNAFENSNRVSIYKNMRKAGASRLDAAYEARDVLDFSKRGANNFIRFLVESAPFWNARLQGLYRIGRSPGGKKKVMISMAVRGMLIASITLGLGSLFGNDDRYKELTSADKALYWHFWIEGKHFKIPKPFEVGSIFGTVPEVMMDYFVANAKEPDRAKQAAAMIGFTATQALNLTPDIRALMPLAELAMNYDTFAERPILNTRDLEVLPSEQDSPSVHSTYRLLSSLVPGLAPDAFQSPKQLQHLARGYIGGLQDYVLVASDMLSRKAMGEPEAPTMALPDIPGLRTIVTSGPPRSTKYANTLYTVAQQAAKLSASIDAASDPSSERGDARVEELETENPALLDVAEDFKRAIKEVRKLQSDQRDVQLDPNMTPDQKREELDQNQRQINDIAKELYDLRPGGKLTPDTAALLLGAPEKEQIRLLEQNGLPATAKLLREYKVA